MKGKRARDLRVPGYLRKNKEKEIPNSGNAGEWKNICIANKQPKKEGGTVIWNEIKRQKIKNKKKTTGNYFVVAKRIALY